MGKCPGHHSMEGEGRPSNLAEEIGKKRGFDSLAQEAFLNLARTYSVLSREWAVFFRKYGLTEQQYNVLRIVQGAGRTGIHCEPIVRGMMTIDPDVTRLVDRLVKQGLVQRQRCERDRRVVLVTLTDEGKALLKKLRRPVLALHEKQLGHLGDRKLATISALLFEARHADYED